MCLAYKQLVKQIFHNLVLIMFFYRFFHTARKQMGSLKALGFTDNTLCSLFMKIIAVLSFGGSCIGLVCGYFSSRLKIDVSSKTIRKQNYVPKIADGITISKIERTEQLERNSVSNNFSSFMNSILGVVIGSILIFLAL